MQRTEFYEPGPQKCFLCEEEDWASYRSTERFGFTLEFRKCRCGVASQHPLPNKRFYDWFFNSALFESAKKSGSKEIWGFYDFFADERARFLTSKLRMRMLRRHFPASASRILKIGPATGTFLKLAQDIGHEVFGCDISPKFSEFALEKYDVKIDVGRFEDLPYSDVSFDLILALSIWENLPDPLGFMRLVRSKLKPGGALVLNYVNMERNLVEKFQKSNYFLFRPPVAHIYTTRLIYRLARKSGFKIEREIPDIRFMHAEKLFSTLGWQFAVRVVQRLRIAYLPFPFIAYPSKIIVLRKCDDSSS